MLRRKDVYSTLHRAFKTALESSADGS